MLNMFKKSQRRKDSEQRKEGSGAENPFIYKGGGELWRQLFRE